MATIRSNADLGDIEAFVAVGRALSFSEAGRRLGAPRSTLSKQIMRLEERLGARLLQRTTRKVALTDTGAAYLAVCQRALEDIENAERAAVDVSGNPRGELRVALSFDLARDLLAPLLKEFHARYPDITLHIVADQRRVDLVAEGFDVAIRGGPQQDASLVSRLLMRADLIACASPAYLKVSGAPKTAADLKDHDLLSMPHPLIERMLGIEASDKRPWLVANEWGVLRQALVDGMGIGLLIRQAWQDDFDNGRLVQVLPEIGLADGVCAVYPSRHHLSRKVRVFVDFLAERLGQADRGKPRVNALDRQGPDATRKSVRGIRRT